MKQIARPSTLFFKSVTRPVFVKTNSYATNWNDLSRAEALQAAKQKLAQSSLPEQQKKQKEALLNILETTKPVEEKMRPEDAIRNKLWNKFKRLKAVGQKASVSTYNDYLYQLIKNGDSVTAKQMYEDMKESNIEPDVETFAMLVGSCLYEANSLRAVEYLKQMASFKIAPTPKFFTVLREIFAADKKDRAAKVAAQYENRAVSVADFEGVVKQLQAAL